MKLASTLLLVLVSVAVTADQVIRPPVDQKTLVGTWEALLKQHPPLLFHMEINRADDSYLVQVTVGDTEYVVRRLLSSELASLHSSPFRKVVAGRQNAGD